TQRGDFSKIPWDLSITSPDTGWTGWNVAPGMRLDMRLGKRASLHASARYTRIEGDIDVEALLGIEPDGRTLDRYHYRELSTWQESQSDSFVEIQAHSGSIGHKIVAGVEAGYSTTDTMFGVCGSASLDMYSPVYGTALPDPALSPVRYDVLRVGTYGID